MTEHWYHLVHGKQFGPYSFKGLRERVQMGVLHPDDEVLRDGAKEWVEAATVPGLFAADAQVTVKVETVSGVEPPVAAAPRWLVPTACLVVGIAIGMGLMALLIGLNR